MTILMENDQTHPVTGAKESPQRSYATSATTVSAVGDIYVGLGFVIETQEQLTEIFKGQTWRPGLVAVRVGS